MACCLTAPSHHLNQCWLIKEVLSCSIHLRTILQEMLKLSTIKIYSVSVIFPEGQWVNSEPESMLMWKSCCPWTLEEINCCTRAIVLSGLSKQCANIIESLKIKGNFLTHLPMGDMIVLISIYKCNELCYFRNYFNDWYFNRQHAGTELIWFNIVNIMVADFLAPCVARPSASMILTM